MNLLNKCIKTTFKNIVMSNLSQGTYLVKLFTDNNTTDKIIIKK